MIRRLFLLLPTLWFAAVAHAEELGLAQAQALWRAAGIDAYRYEYQKFCECHPTEPATTVATVSKGHVVEVRYRVSGLPDVVLADDRIAWYWTVEDLFALIARERSNPSLRVSYDAKLGFPVRIYVDREATTEGDEIDVRVSALAALPE